MPINPNKEKTMSLRRILIVTTLALAPLMAAAHEAQGPHGGRLTDIAGGHLELVPSADALTLYLTDGAEKPRATAGIKGRAVIQSAGKTVQTALTPEAPNLLTTKLDAALPKGSIVVVSATLDGKSIQARFTIE